MERKGIDYASLNQERIICIADLLKEIIRKLWLVIVVAIIFAALLGGYKYMKDTKAAESTKESASAANLTDELNEEDAKAVNNVLWIWENLTQQREYAENSVLMQINAYDESNVTMLYYLDGVSNTTEEGARSLIDAYESYINNGALTADLKQKGVELDAQYISELISCEVTTDMVSDESGALTLENGNSFNIKVIHENEEDCLALAAKITDCLKSYQSALQQSMGGHSLTLVEQSYSEVVDRSLWTYKLDRTNSIISMQDRITELEANMSSEQLDIIEKYTEKADSLQDENTEEMEPAETSHVSISKKYVALGGLIGIVLACLFIIACYILGGTIQKAEDLQYIYNLRVLGEISEREKHNIFLAIWNRLIGKKEVKLSLEEEKALLLSNLCISCKKENIKKILLGSGRNINVNQVYINDLICELKKAGIDAEYMENILYSSEAFVKMATGCDSIVLLEKVRDSRYDEVSKELKACMEQDVKILGAVVLS